MQKLTVLQSCICDSDRVSVSGEFQLEFEMRASRDHNFKGLGEQGLYGSWDFVIFFSRPGKSWILIVGH